MTETAARPTSPVESVVLFTVDTLRADALGGSLYGDMPAARRLAEESLVFEHAYSQATLTHPALTSMLTGLVPPRHGVNSQSSKLDPGAVPLQTWLQQRGVATGSFVANLCKLQEQPGTVFGDGWDERYCGMDEEREQYLWDRDVVDAGLAWIAAQDGPFFAWIHLMDPHAEHRPPPDQWDWEADPPREKFEQYRYMNAWEERREFPPADELERLLALYRAEVAGVDAQLARVLAALDGLQGAGSRDRTAFVFSADHGEELYETWSRYDHGFSLTEGVLRVPLMLRAPGLQPERATEVVETLQVAPTVLGLLGFEAPYRLDGPSLLAYARERRFALSFSLQVAVTLRTPEYRYWFRTTQEPWTRAEDEAPWRADAPWFQFRKCLAEYDPRHPTTPRWLSPQEPDSRRTAAQLQQEFKAFLRELGPLPTTEPIRDADVLEQLESLGYLGDD